MLKEIDPNYIERFGNRNPYREGQTSERDEYEYLQYETYNDDDEDDDDNEENERIKVLSRPFMDD